MGSMSEKIVVACPYCKALYRVPQSFSGKPLSCPKCRHSFPASEARITATNPENEGFLLCKIALNYGFITEDRLKYVMTAYARIGQSNGNHLMEKLLVSHGGLSEGRIQLAKDIRQNWDMRLAEKRFAQEAVERGFISPDTARKALIRQAQIFQESRTVSLLSDMLIRSGDMTPAQCDDIFTGQHRDHRRPFPNTTPVTRAAVKPDASMQPNPAILETAAGPRPDPAKPEAKPSAVFPPVSESTKPPQVSSPPEEVRPIPSSTPQPPPRIDDDRPKPAPLPPEPKPEPEKVQETPHAPDAPPRPPDPAPSSPAVTPQRSEAPDSSEKSDEPSQESTVTTECLIDSQGGKIILIKGLELILDPAGLSATLKVPEGVDPFAASISDIKTVLFEENIVFGIVEDSLIRGFLNSKIFREKPFTIAEGVTPRPGVHGQVRFFFDTDYLKIGAITDKGNIDFKNRGEIPYVEEGTLLAEISPAVKGKPGRDIYGQDIPVDAVREVFLRCESGVRMSEDKTRVFAAVSGQPKLNFGDRIQVLSELTIPGDVGFETGHVEFEGNVIIKGAVLEDFIVTGANITAREIVGATINASGDLTVKDGMSNSTLNVVGTIQAKFIHKCTINAYGNVSAEKEIIDCRIENSGACLVERGKIISSQIASKMGVTAKEIGTEMSSPNRIKIGVDDHITRETDLIDAQIETYNATLEELRKTLEDFTEQEKETHKQITALAHVQDRAQIGQKSLQNSLERLGSGAPSENIREVEAQIKQLARKAQEADESINRYFDQQDKIMAARDACHERIGQCEDRISDLKRQKKDKIKWAKSMTGIAYLKTTGAIFGGTVVSGAHCTKTFKETMRHVTLREVVSAESPEGWEMKLS